MYEISKSKQTWYSNFLVVKVADNKIEGTGRNPSQLYPIFPRLPCSTHEHGPKVAAPTGKDDPVGTHFPSLLCLEYDVTK